MISAPASARSDQKGIALVVVLWVLALLSVIALEFAYAMRTEVDIWNNHKDDLKGYFLARAGVDRAVLEIMRYNQFRGLPQEERKNELWRPDGSAHEVTLDEGGFKVAIEDEGGKLNVNYASEQTLRSPLEGLEIPEEQASVIADSILDWRDTDDLHRLNGAEKEYYNALAEPYDCKDGNFDSVEELTLVRGVTRDIYAKLAGKVTVYPQGTGQASGGAININTASPAVLKAVFMDDTLVNDIIDKRKEKEITPQEFSQLMAGRPNQGAIGTSPAGCYTIISTGRAKDSKTARSVKAIVALAGTECRIMQWTDRWWELHTAKAAATGEATTGASAQ